MSESPPPRVFISYSHDSPEHQDRVLALADRLVGDGVDAVLDQYAPHPSQGWPRWTEQQIESADFVLVVCTATYLRRVEGCDGPGAGRGVLWEVNLIYNHLYAAGCSSEKFIPVLLDPAADGFVPTPMQGMTRYSLIADAGYDALYRRLTDQPAAARPAIGKLRSLPNRQPKSYPSSFAGLASAVPPGHRDRTAILARVRHDWIQGVLERSLHDRTALDLVLANCFNLELETSEREPERLPPGYPISKAFDDHLGALLILGDPGSGKTTLLLSLAKSLVNRAELDVQHPIPVVFNLSSWAVHQLRLASWLAAELNEHYDVPRNLAEVWIDAAAVLPLLDGLDEVGAEHRQSCVEAINAFRRENGLLPIVVTSRTGDYESLSTRLRVPGAVIIQRLTPAQVRQYLAEGGEPLSQLQTAVERDPALLEFLETPLLVETAVGACRQGPDASITLSGDPDRDRNRLLARYVSIALTAHGSRDRYASKEILNWLSWLAQGMRRRHQSLFQIESLCTDWLGGKNALVLYSTVVLACAAFSSVLLFLGTDRILLPALGLDRLRPFSESQFGLGSRHADWMNRLFDPSHWLTVALLSGGLGILGAFFAIWEFSETWSWSKLKRSALQGLACGSLIGGRFGFSVGVIIGPVSCLAIREFSTPMKLATVPIAAMAAGLVEAVVFAALAAVLGAFFFVGFHPVRPTASSAVHQQIPDFDWRSVLSGARFGARRGLVVGLLAGTLFGGVLGGLSPLEQSPDPQLLLRLFSVWFLAILGGLAGCPLGSLAGAVAGAAFRTALPALRLPEPRDAVQAIHRVAPVDKIRWSWSRITEGLGTAGRLGFSGALVLTPITATLGAISGAILPFVAEGLPEFLGLPDPSVPVTLPMKLITAMELAPQQAALNAVISVFAFVVLLAPLGFIEGMLERTELESRPVANLGTRRSIRTALFSGVVASVVLSLVAALLGLLAKGPIPLRESVMMNGLFGAQCGFTLAALRNGGLFVIQHVIVRIVLWLKGAAPLRYVRFLDSCATGIPFLRKVGGSYMFTHRFLLEHLANRGRS